VLKNVSSICIEEIYSALVECIRPIKAKKTKERKRGFKYIQDLFSTKEEKEDKTESNVKDGSIEIQDCIMVKPR